jgi:hypothetical protein
MMSLKMKFFILILSLTLIVSQKRLEDDDDNFDIFEARKMINDLEDNFLGGNVNLSWQCFSTISGLKSVVDILRKETDTETALVNAAKEFAKRIPGLKSACSITLPTIDLSRLNPANIKSKCSSAFGTFSYETGRCLNGSFTGCFNILAEIKNLANCLSRLK